MNNKQFNGEIIKEIAQMIKDNDGIMLISHISPDGDTLGSACALMLALRKMGKIVCAVCDGSIPSNLSIMPGIEEVKREAPFLPAVSIAIDCADKKRIGNFIEEFDKSPICIAIDHHETNDGYAKINAVDSKASATAELVYALISELGIDIDRAIATCLYIALSTDTGNFSYSNTNENTFIIASKLLTTGFDMTAIHRSLFRVRSFPKTQLLGLAISQAKLYFDGRMVMATLSYKEISAIANESAMSEGIIDILRDIEGVEIAVYMHQTAEGIHRVSLRSNAYIDVCSIALEFGGGGHIRAAGCGMSGPIDEVQSKLIAAIALCIEPPPSVSQ